MFSSITSTIKKLVGSKADRDIREIGPKVELIKKIYPSLATLSNDELRQKTIEFKERINNYIKDDIAQVEDLKSKAEAEENVDLKEELYKQSDENEENINDRLEEVLNEILPEAFAVIKETAKRFTENEEVVVTANDRDRDIAAQRDSVIINGTKTIWKNRWMAAGSEVQWSMIHYDVQLIGGI